MTFTATYTLPGLPKSLNGSHGHWFQAAKERKNWRGAMCATARLNRPVRPLVDVELIITRFSAVAMDHDNRVAACKPVVDGLRDAGVILDDTDRVIKKREYPQGKALPGKGHVEIKVQGRVMDEAEWSAHMERIEKRTAKREAKKLKAAKGKV